MAGKKEAEGFSWYDNEYARGLLSIAAIAGIVVAAVIADPGGEDLVQRMFVWAFVVFAVGLAELFLLFIVLAVLGKVSLANAFLDKAPGEGEGSVSLARLQAFLWTLIVMIIYFHEAVIREPGTGLPTIPPELLTLMGISGAVYLASKQIDQRKPKETPE